MTTPPRAAIYTRISADQKGDSLGVARQEELCRQLAVLQDAEIVGVYSDNDISAYNGKRRPGFEDLLTAIRDHQVDVLICWHTDRLYRRLKDLVRLTEAGPRLLIKTVTGGDLDLSNATGKMVATILASVQQQESEHHSERRCAANMQRAEAGKWQAQSQTFGYGRDGMPLEPQATAYRQAVTDVLNGKSIRSICVDWNARGLLTTKGKPWASPRLRRLLVNPRYGGIVVHKGKVMEGVEPTWTPLIDADVHRGLVAYLSDPARVCHTSFERKYIGTGIYRCGKCGGVMKATRPQRKAWAYRCGEKGCVVRSGEPVDQMVVDAVLARLSLPDAGLRLDTPNRDLAELRTRRAALVADYEQLSTLLLEHVLDGPTARRNAADLKAKFAGIDRQLADAVSTSPAASLAASGQQLKAKWDAMSPTVKGQVVEQLVVVTVLPSPRGLHRFDPAYVDVKWAT